ncbi:MAG: hypothetical protein FWD17_17685 [Polyangiaceae bacterium]|nr:hypothetical protein [Polyangiaceae bacterium]
MALSLALTSGCAPSARRPPAGAPTVVQAEARIVTPTEVATESELADRAERALMEQRWRDAAAAYGLLVDADPNGPRAVAYRFNLGLALEGAEERARARDAYVEIARVAQDAAAATATATAATATFVRRALVRAATLDAYLEAWDALAQMGDALLAREDIDVVDRLVGLGARGLARIELGDDARASHDILDGLDLADGMHYGDRDVLPVAVAQLRFALGEVRRVRSERIQFDPLPPDFLDALERRCAGLLDAQTAYAEAVRSVDPHWAAMAGYRVGAMYRALHDDLMRIPAPETSRTDRQKQIFFAFMHVRYRVLLEKGLRELEQTIALGERANDDSEWIRRAQDAKREMQASLSAEDAALASMPFTKAEIQTALDLLQKRTRGR